MVSDTVLLGSMAAIHPGSRQPFCSQLHPPPTVSGKCQVGALLLGKLMIKTRGKKSLEVFLADTYGLEEVLNSENDHVYS